MSDKKKKQFIILISVLVVLLLCYIGIYVFTTEQEKKEANQAEENTIYMTDITDVAAVKYCGGSDTLSFAKNEDGDWFSVDDEAFPLDSDTVELIVSTYSKLIADRELTDGDSIADYGLDAPVYYVTLTSDDGSETTVNIGNVAEDDTYYAMVDGQDTVYTIGADCVTDIQTPLNDMARLDTFPSVGSGNIVSETIESNGQKTTYEADDKEDEEAVATVVGGLSVISFDTPVDYHMADSDAAKYGLDEDGRTTVTVVYTDDDDKEQSVTLYIGKEDGSGNQYVQMDGSKIVYIVTTEICNNILNVSDQAVNTEE